MPIIRPFPVLPRVPNGGAGPGRNGPDAGGNGTEPGPSPLRNHSSGVMQEHPAQAPAGP